MTKNGRSRRHLFFLLVFATMLSATVWYALDWYTTGEEPRTAVLPSSVSAAKSVDETPLTKADVDTYKVPANQPRYISIPALGIERARVQAVGLTKNNELDTPRNVSDTAWYDKSAHPGQGDGVVLMNGHSGGYSRDGVFVNLNKLKVGNKIVIQRGDGKKLVYRVAENRTESLREVNRTGMSRLIKPYDRTKEGLGLITCAGNWVPSDKAFDKRVLVRAVILND